MLRSLMCCAVIGFTAILSATASSFGGTVFLDDFNKSNQPLTGTTPNIGGVWTNVSSTSNPIQIVSNAVVMGAAGGEDALSLTDGIIPTTVGNVIHTGLDINVSSATAAGDYFQHLGDGSTSVFFQRLFARSSGNGYQLGLVDTSGTGSTITYGTTVLNFGTSNHVDINWTPVAGNSNDTFALLPGKSYYWRVETHGALANLDAAAGPNGFLDPFSGDYYHLAPEGPRRGSGSFTISNYSDKITIAP